jgi:hypothetical protein
MLGAIVTTSVQVAIEREPLAGRWPVIASDSVRTSAGTRSLLLAHGVANALPSTALSADATSSRPLEGRRRQQTAAPSAPPDRATVAGADTASALGSSWPVVVLALWAGGAAFGLGRFALAHLPCSPASAMVRRRSTASTWRISLCASS